MTSANADLTVNDFVWNYHGRVGFDVGYVPGNGKISNFNIINPEQKIISFMQTTRDIRTDAAARPTTGTDTVQPNTWFTSAGLSYAQDTATQTYFHGQAINNGVTNVSNDLETNNDRTLHKLSGQHVVMSTATAAADLVGTTMARMIKLGARFVNTSLDRQNPRGFMDTVMAATEPLHGLYHQYFVLSQVGCLIESEKLTLDAQVYFDKMGVKVNTVNVAGADYDIVTLIYMTIYQQNISEVNDCLFATAFLSSLGDASRIANEIYNPTYSPFYFDLRGINAKAFTDLMKTTYPIDETLLQSAKVIFLRSAGIPDPELNSYWSRRVDFSDEIADLRAEFKKCNINADNVIGLRPSQIRARLVHYSFPFYLCFNAHIKPLATGSTFNTKLGTGHSMYLRCQYPLPARLHEVFEETRNPNTSNDALLLATTRYIVRGSEKAETLGFPENGRIVFLVVCLILSNMFKKAKLEWKFEFAGQYESEYPTYLIMNYFLSLMDTETIYPGGVVGVQSACHIIDVDALARVAGFFERDSELFAKFKEFRFRFSTLGIVKGQRDWKDIVTGVYDVVAEAENLEKRDLESRMATLKTQEDDFLAGTSGVTDLDADEKEELSGLQVQSQGIRRDDVQMSVLDRRAKLEHDVAVAAVAAGNTGDPLQSQQDYIRRQTQAGDLFGNTYISQQDAD